MSTAIVPLGEMERMAAAIATSGLFGMKTKDQALALMIVAQAENRHPGSVAAEYHIIQGRPALKADAMLARFQQAGGVVEWMEYTDKKVSAHFSHPVNSPKPVLIEWTVEQATKAGLAGKDNWKNYPRQMLRARVVSEGVRTVYPAVCVGVYTPEEVQDFEPAGTPRKRKEKDITAEAQALSGQESTARGSSSSAGPASPEAQPAASGAPESAPDALIVRAREMAESGESAYKGWWESISAADRKHVGAKRHEELKSVAAHFDRAGQA